MANTHKIKIKEGFDSGHLKLKPKHTYAKNKEFIRWTIECDEVTSIEGIEKKSGTDIFKVLPHQDGSTSDWIAEIHDNLPDDSVYVYKIVWNGKFGRRETDPKISVNPTDSDIFMKVIIGVAVAVSLAIFSLRLLQKRSKGKY